jgi:protein-S-isoprenylcysteine O-methyltransferase Ste14
LSAGAPGVAFALARTVVYASLFIGLVLVYLPAQLLGIARPPEALATRLLGVAVASSGGVLAVWSILSVAVLGRGTPAPFDPPVRLVVRGPYRFVRNPMYIGAGLALLGAALLYQSLALLAYGVGFFATTHLFVVAYEEPTLRRTFGAEYDAYLASTGRWLPRSRRGRGA